MKSKGFNGKALMGKVKQERKKNPKRLLGNYSIKVSKFQNEFIKSSFLPKYEPKIVRIFLPCSVAQYRAEILTIFGSYFKRNNDLIN